MLLRQRVKAFGNLQRRTQVGGIQRMAPLTYEHHIEGWETFKGTSQGFRTLITKSRLGCSHPSNYCYKVSRLHEYKELIFRSETLPLGGFKGRSPISAFEEVCQS